MPRRSASFIVSSIAAVALGAAAVSTAHAEPARISLQVHFNPNLSVIGEVTKNFVDNVQAIAGEDIRIRFYEAGKLVPTFETLTAVRDGNLDAVHGWPGYFMGTIPALTLFSAVPFGPNADEYVTWMLEGNGQKLANEIFNANGVHALFCGVIEAEASGWFRKEINSVEDLKGLKIRYAGLGGEVLAKLGASVTVLAAGEIFPNLERGVLDATEFSMPSIDRNLGFYKVAKHYYFPGWHQPGSTAFLMMNKKKWDGLTPRQQAVLDVACRAAVTYELARGIGEQATAMEYYRSQGINIHSWSPEMMEIFRKTSAEVMAEQAAKDADFKRIYDDQQQFLKGVRGWSGIGMLRQD